MKVSAVLHVHNHPALVEDTLDSIYLWMTNQIHVIVDEAGWHNFSEFKYKDVELEKGFFHNIHRCPYKNVALSLKRVYEKWPDSDWFCYIEYDCLVISDLFMKDLKHFKNRAWLLANDIRVPGHTLPPMFTDLLGKPLWPGHIMLGCCVFYHRDFLKKLHEEFFGKFLEQVKDFPPGFYPDFRGYALEEEMFPSLAAFYGGRVEQLAAWKGGPIGNFTRYPMRHPEVIYPYLVTPLTSIIHPLKNYDDPIRVHFRRLRSKLKK